ncbi:MAG: VanW family protein [Clostridia bacterium]|nr:VanW family protein [Clostridia bacterium]
MVEEKNTEQKTENEVSSENKSSDTPKAEETSSTETKETETATETATTEPQPQSEETAKTDEQPDSSLVGIMNDVRQKTQTKPIIRTQVATEEEMFDINSVLGEEEEKKAPKKDEKVQKAEPQKENPPIVAEQPKQQEESSEVVVDEPEEKEKRGIGTAFVKILCGFLVSAAIVGGTFFCMYKYSPSVIPVAASVNIPGGQVKAPKEKVVFLKGIQVEGFDLGGKTLEEAKSLLAVRGPSLLPKTELSVVYEGNEYKYSNEDLSFSYDLNSVVERAYEYSNYVIGEGSKDVMAYLPNDGNIEVDAEKGNVNFRVDYKVTQSSVKKVMQRVAKKVDRPCVEPHVSKFDTSKEKNSQRYTFVDGTKGKIIDQDALIRQAMEQLNQGEKKVVLAATSIESVPQLNIADVKQATKLIGKFSTISSNSANANSNMATALAAINGTILEPGEVISFNDCTGNSNLMSNGYLPAGVISQGAMTTGIGGGICQAATTLYNAGIMANMEIVEREPHLWCSFYVYGGLDATIDWGAIDLKMKNNSKYQMFFRCWMDGIELNVEIYGWQSPEFDEVRTETELDWSSYESYGYNAYRVFYKNGKKLKKEELPYSVYSLSNGAGIRPADYGDTSRKLTQPE